MAGFLGILFEVRTECWRALECEKTFRAGRRWQHGDTRHASSHVLTRGVDCIAPTVMLHSRLVLLVSWSRRRHRESIGFKTKLYMSTIHHVDMVTVAKMPCALNATRRQLHELFEEMKQNPNWPIGFWLTDNRHNDDYPPQTIYRNYP